VIAEIVDPAALESEVAEDALRSGGRLVVIGDADFAGNALASLIDNGDLFLNTVHFLVGDEAQLGSDDREDAFLLLSTRQLAIVFLIGVLIVPGLAGLAGLWIVVRRRFL
jgi:ABC-type uncharacterized transport system involved in gliding motility auxiliary subunit